MIEQLPTKAWDNRNLPYYLTILPYMPKEFQNKYGVKFEKGTDGLGELEYCVLKIGGLKYLLESHTDGPKEATLMNVSISSSEQDLEKHIDILLEALTLNYSDLVHIQEKLGEPKWILCRQDDNDNEFEMGRFYLKETCERQSRIYQEKGHKQIYYVKKAT